MDELINALSNIKKEDIVKLYELQYIYDGTVIGDTLKLNLHFLEKYLKSGKFAIRSIQKEKIYNGNKRS